MQPYKTIYLTAFLITFLGSCSTKSNHCDVSFKPKVTTNPTVVAGDTLKLHVSSPSDVYMYNWYGPGGYTSHDSAPAITGTSSDNAGRYHVDIITKGGCIYSAVSDSIVVTAPVIPCSPGANTAFISGASSTSFYHVTGGPNGGSYFITANGGNGDLTLEFFGSNRPGSGKYSIQGTGGLWGPGNVRVTFNASSSWWTTSSGTVYAYLTNGKISVTCCTTDVYSSTWNVRTTAGFQVMVP